MAGTAILACGGGKRRGPGNLSPSEAGLSPPDAGICEGLAQAARARTEAFLQQAYPPTCAADSDCALLDSLSINCFLPCFGLPVRTVDLPAVELALRNSCDTYFAAGCPTIALPCQSVEPVCDHGACSSR